ncbi:MAG: nuclear transport factor 2 family protein [Gammaproteobacteria bacterium]
MERDHVLGIATSFFRLATAGRTDEAMAVLDDDGTWWANGFVEPLPMRQMKPIVREIFARNDVEFQVITATVEGSRAVLETRNRMRFGDGTEMDARYVFAVEVGGSRIVAVREYQDTAKSEQVLRPRIAGIVKGIAATKP